MAQRFPRWIAPLSLALALTAGAATQNNDDSCDLALMPAATLLLPYFEVDLDERNGETTLVTITNAGNLDAIARVTLWTDRAYPVLTFNVYLTGYDVQSLNLFDILERGLIAPDAGTGTHVGKRGRYSDASPALDLGACARLPGLLPNQTILDMQAAFTTGSRGECEDIGGVHDNAVGYATIDVVGNCSSNAPLDREYWTSDLRYDNVLLGEYQQILGAESYAQGGPLVHIRAIPEGGTPRQRRASRDPGFARTFYGRYQPSSSPKLDARQPLPSQFAARWIQGGEGAFKTSLKIWREARAGIDATCGDYEADESLAVREIVTFDEQENAVGAERFELPATSRTSVDDAGVYPQLANGATSGWMYLNLDRSGRDDYAGQAWILSSMRAERRYSADVDAIALGNGCSAPAERSEVSVARGAPIAPAPNPSAGRGIASTDNDDSCDIALLPAATLLLPYFSVNADDPNGETTIFTLTNVSPSDQIARVTLWTDYAFPVITFNVYLTGYDVQSISLYDVIARGIIAPDAGTGTSITARGPYSDRNRGLDLSDCAQLPGQLPQAYVARMQIAFTDGIVPELAGLPACNNVGNEHDDATGYATIDVVRNCSPNSPMDEEYWTEDLAWDNVLIGDSFRVLTTSDYAGGSALVHVRAVPEGGTAEERIALPRKYDAGFPRTFYGRYQPALSPKLDGRQPLPTVFAARWIQGGPSAFRTDVQIWREGRRGREVTCATLDDNIGAVAEVVRFDEDENAVGDAPSSLPYPYGWSVTLPATSRFPTDDASLFPQLANGAISGWMYLNLDDDDSNRNMASPFATQNWIATTMRAEGRYSVQSDAAALGNGCSPQVPHSEVTIGTAVIGPLANENP